VTSMNVIGLDIHKKTISYCVKDVAGAVLAEGTIPSTRQSLDDWIRTLHQPWTDITSSLTGNVRIARYPGVIQPFWSLDISSSGAPGVFEVRRTLLLKAARK
jgi:hypothetical protein